MEIIYYKDSKLKVAPVRVYFVDYENNGKLIKSIKAKIWHIGESGGFIVNCDFCEKAIDFDGWKIKQNFNKKVIRILYDYIVPAIGDFIMIEEDKMFVVTNRILTPHSEKRF